MKTVSFSKNQLKALLSCVAKKDVRFYLHGVHVQCASGRTIAESTDGHCLFHAKLSTPHVEDFDVIIPSRTIEAVIKMAGKLDSISLFCDDANRWTLGAVQLSPIYGTFADTARVIPEGYLSGEPGQYDPAYLKRALDGIRDWFNDPSLIIPLGYNGPHNVAKYEHEGVLALIMPWRTEKLPS